MESVEQLWQAAVLDTRYYADLQAALGLTLHHPGAPATAEELSNREAHMLARYYQFFCSYPITRFALSQPTSSPDEYFQIFMEDRTGGRVALLVSPTHQIYQLKQMYQAKKPVQPGIARMFYGTTLLEYHRKLEEYPIIAGATIFVLLVEAPC